MKRTPPTSWHSGSTSGAKYCGHRQTEDRPSVPMTQRTPADGIASSVSRVFLGVRIGCSKCHNHPFADWRQDDFWGMAAFFASSSVGQANAPADTKVAKIKPMESDKEYPVRFLWTDEAAA